MVGIRIFREMKRLVKSVEMKTGLWKSLKCLTLLFDGDTYKNSLSSLRVCFNNSLNTTEQYYYILTLHFGYIDHFGYNRGSGTTLVVTVILAHYNKIFLHLLSPKLYLQQ